MHELADQVLLTEVGKAAGRKGVPKEDIEEQNEKSISTYHQLLQSEATKMHQGLQELSGLKKNKKARKMIQAALQEYEFKCREWNLNFKILEDACVTAV